MTKQLRKISVMCSQAFVKWAPDGSGLIPGLRPANERRRYKVTPYLIGWTQT